MTVVGWAIALLAAGVFGIVAAAGAYAERHRAPDQS
jgi:hypothetical protein